VAMSRTMIVTVAVSDGAGGVNMEDVGHVIVSRPLAD
jgi:hypothetical protein